MPLPPQTGQQAQRPGAEGRGHIGLEPQPPHLQIGFDHPLRQLTGQCVIVVFYGVGRHQIGSVGAVGTPLRQKGGKPWLLPGIVHGSGLHDPQSEAPHLMGKQPSAVPPARLVPVALLQHRPAQGIHRIADHAEHSSIAPLPGHAGIADRQFPVHLILGHADIPGGNGGIRHEPGGAEQEHIPVKHLLR